MYIYTDDDLTRINRDYLGPKGKRLPWVASYRTYGIATAVLLGMAALYMILGIPLNQWTGLLYFFACALILNYVVQRMNRDVSLLAMAKAGWQEVTVPRAARPNPKDHTLHVAITMHGYDAQPAPTWWERHFKSSTGTRKPSAATVADEGTRRAARQAASK